MYYSTSILPRHNASLSAGYVQMSGVMLRYPGRYTPTSLTGEWVHFSTAVPIQQDSMSSIPFRSLKERLLLDG